MVLCSCWILNFLLVLLPFLHHPTAKEDISLPYVPFSSTEARHFESCHSKLYVFLNPSLLRCESFFFSFRIFRVHLAFFLADCLDQVSSSLHFAPHPFFLAFACHKSCVAGRKGVGEFICLIWYFFFLLKVILRLKSLNLRYVFKFCIFFSLYFFQGKLGDSS